MHKIAIVDDEPLMLEGFSKAIDWNAYGYELTGVFKNADHILEFCKQEPPDILLLDIGMPGKDGITLLKEIKSSFPQIYIIMLTAHNEFEYVRESLRHRADEYLWKPEIEFTDILSCMDRLMESAHAVPPQAEEERAEFIDYAERECRFVPERFNRLLEGLQSAMEMDNVPQLREGTAALWEMIVRDRPRKCDISSGILHLVFLYQEWLRKHGAGAVALLKEDDIMDVFRRKTTYEELTEILRNLLEERNLYIEANRAEEHTRLKSMIAAYLTQNMEQTDLNLMSLSKAFGISYSYFSRIFPEIMGKNFSKYLIELRLEKACAYLKESDFCIDKILELVGYHDKSYFIKSFKSYMGMTPSRYRSEFKRER